MGYTAFLLMVINILSKILGFFREILLSYFYGTGEIATAFQISFLVPYTILGFVMSGLSTNFIPTYTSLENKKGRNESDKFTNNILNIILDLILVIVFNLGVIGVGFATLISQIVSAILIFIILLRTKLDCKIYINRIRFYKKYLKEIFRLGLPIGVQSVLYPISNTIIQSSINTFGVNSIAAWAISGKLDFLIWTVSDAFSIAISTFVAQNYGAKKHQRARDGIKVALFMSMVVIFVISSILYLYNKPLAHFLIDDKNIVDLTSQVIHLIAPLYFVYVIGDILSGAIRGIGDTFNPMIINIFGICICRVLWIFFIVPLNPTFFMVLYGFIVSWIITTIMYITYIIYKRKSF